jgi:hypothetical protein
LDHHALIEINLLEETLNDFVNKIHYICSQPHYNQKVFQHKMLRIHLFIEAKQFGNICEYELTNFPIITKIKN